MATKPTKPAAPAAKPAAAAKKKGGKRVLVWGLLGLVVLFLGVGAALWFMSGGKMDRESLMSGGGLWKRSATRPGEPGMAPEPGAPPSMGEGDQGAMGPGGQVQRSYRVKEGENLWRIASKGVLVEDPWEWRTIMVQNKDKIDYAFVSEESGEWKVMVESGEELVVKARPPEPTQGPVTKKFAVQLMTVPAKQMKRALTFVKSLLADGYYGYLYRIEDNGQAAYRVRVGFYDTQDQADGIARQILAKYAGQPDAPKQYWVMVPSDRELRGELLDFGAQRAKPWVIELPMRGTQGEALEEMKAAGGIGDFVYIAQGRGNNMSQWVYRTRIGFFETREQAEAVMAMHREALPQLADAHVIERTNFHETLPGQNFRLGKSGG